MMNIEYAIMNVECKILNVEFWALKFNLFFDNQPFHNFTAQENQGKN
jgi:hypothetical protein